MISTQQSNNVDGQNLIRVKQKINQELKLRPLNESFSTVP